MLLNIANAEFIPPFGEKVNVYKRRAIRDRGNSGVYIIRENGIIVYVGMSQSCVTEALYRHFYRYNDAHRKVRTYYEPIETLLYTTVIIYTSKEDAPKLESGLILSIQPRDNTDLFNDYLNRLTESTQQYSSNPNNDDLPF